MQRSAGPDRRRRDQLDLVGAPDRLPCRVVPAERAVPLGLGDTVQERGGFHPVAGLPLRNDLGQRATSMRTQVPRSVRAPAERRLRTKVCWSRHTWRPFSTWSSTSLIDCSRKSLVVGGTDSVTGLAMSAMRGADTLFVAGRERVRFHHAHPPHHHGDNPGCGTSYATSSTTGAPWVAGSVLPPHHDRSR